MRHRTNSRRGVWLGILQAGLVVAACVGAARCGAGEATEPSPVFQVASATIEVAPQGSNWTATGETCPTAVSLVVHVAGPVKQTQTEAYSYQWERSDGTVVGPSGRAVPVSSGAGPYVDTYAYVVPVPTTQSGWVQLHVRAPNDVISNRVTWDVTCKAASL